MTATNTYKCYTCEDGFVLNSAGTACLDNTGGDANCVRLNAERDMCLECWWPYWYHGRACLKGNVVGVVSFSMWALVIMVLLGW
jgi:hypothetical protein